MTRSTQNVSASKPSRQILAGSGYEEHKPESDTERRFVDSIIHHYWLMQRAIHTQEELMAQAGHPTEVDGKRLALFLHYSPHWASNY